MVHPDQSPMDARLHDPRSETCQNKLRAQHLSNKRKASPSEHVVGNQTNPLPICLHNARLTQEFLFDLLPNCLGIALVREASAPGSARMATWQSADPILTETVEQFAFDILCLLGNFLPATVNRLPFPLHSIVLIVLISTNTLASLVCYAGKIRHTRRLCTASPKHDGSVSPCGPKAPCHLSGGTICKSLFSQQGFCCLPSKYSALPRIRRHLENALNLALSARQSPMKD